MEQELTTSLILRNRKSRLSIGRQTSKQESPIKRYSIRESQPIRQSIRENHTSISLASSSLEWQKSDYQDAFEAIKFIPVNKMAKASKISYKSDWFGRQEKNQKTLNDKVFNLKGSVQRKLYIFNFIMNVLMRILFVHLLVFLGLYNKWIYLKIFLSLWGISITMYIIVMIKMLFTRSDKESVYFQKIFNEKDWADIESNRLMRTHFNMKKILSKVKVFFNPKTKFEKNTKISFLRQQLYKRMELVVVYFPFTVMFFFNQNDFVTQDKPNFKVYITAAICLEVLRATFTYLVIYIFN